MREAERGAWCGTEANGWQAVRKHHAIALVWAAMKLVFSILLALFISSCASDQAIRNQAEEMHRELEPAILADAELVGYLEAMGDRIVAAARDLSTKKVGPSAHFKEDNSWMFSTEKFHLVSSDQLNAFTTGGSHMYVYTQLLASCRTEDELAAVMAHEFAHVYCRHVHNGMNRQYLSLGAAAALGVAGYAAGGEKHGEEYMGYGLALGLVAGQFLALGFTRDDEAEADRWGFEFYARAGWDPARFGDFFQSLIDQGYDTTPELLSDHPSLKSRVEAARQRAAALTPQAADWRKEPVANKSKFEALKARATAFAKQSGNEAKAKAELLLRAVPSCLLPSDTDKQKDAQAQLRAAQEKAEGSR